MKILELFCGTKSVSNVFKKNAWEVLTVDNNPVHKPDMCFDLLNITDLDRAIIRRFKPDVIWASPPCTKFSIASCSHHWFYHNGVLHPKNGGAIDARKLVLMMLSIFRDCPDAIYFFENPRGMLRKMDIVKGISRHTVTYCQYGDTRMKPTDIWTNCKNWIPRPMCKNGNPCHESAPRGSATGTQGIKNVIDRSRIPRELCEEVYQACNIQER